jgi:hypothetical protein
MQRLPLCGAGRLDGASPVACSSAEPDRAPKSPSRTETIGAIF